MDRPVVAILMGSKSDLPKIQSAVDTFNDFNVPVSVRVMSAHRTPDIVSEFASNASAEGYKIIIAAAGGAAHLAGVVAAHTQLPVLGIPVQGGAFQGLDSLLATVQMPGGIPVATLAVGSAGAKNAALFALRILALSDIEIRAAMLRFSQTQKEKVIAADGELQAELIRQNRD